MATLLEEAVPPPTDAPDPHEGANPLAAGLPPAPEPHEGGGPPTGGEPPAPPSLPHVRLWERPGFRQALWVVAVLLALLLIGVVFPPNFWRF